MKRTFRHARQDVQISLNETAQRYEWELPNAEIGGYAPTEWLAEYIALVAAEEIEKAEPVEQIDGI